MNKLTGKRLTVRICALFLLIESASVAALIVCLAHSFPMPVFLTMVLPLASVAIIGTTALKTLIVYRCLMEQGREESVAYDLQLEETIHIRTSELAQANVQLRRNEQALQSMLADVRRAHENLQRTQDQLVQSEKLASLGQLSAGIAHEINNPLGFIKGNLSTLEKYMLRVKCFYDRLATELESEDPPGRIQWREIADSARANRLSLIFGNLEEMFADMKEGMDRINKIVLNLKLFAREDSSDTTAIDVSEVLDSAVNIVWNEIKYKAEVRKEYNDVQPVLASHQRLGQVFINILINASHAIDEKGVITLWTGMRDGMVCVDIGDTGCGIPETVLKKIFDPFFTTKEAGRGTGLGLSLCHEIVKKYDGRITVRSVPGEGTTFMIALPPALKENA